MGDARELDLEGAQGPRGECQIADEKLAGIAVHVGARVMARRPGRVLVSGTVKDLVAGADFVFDDRGEKELEKASRAGRAVVA